MSHPNPVISPILIAPTATANTLLVGDIINGIGIPVNSEVLSINSIGGGQWEITIDKTPNNTDVYTTGNHVAYLDPSGVDSGDVSWHTDLFITRDGRPFPFVNLGTLSFKEDVKGWVSFKSFIPENAISMANDYYTFLNGKLYKHHVETVNRNTFYGDFTPSSFNVILNDVPGSIKSFNTLNYEGSQTKVDIDLLDNQYFNLTAKKGWYVESVETDQEKGDLNEFIEKEGKWFNYLKGQSVLTDVNNSVIINEDGSSSFDQSSFAIQGIGVYNLLGCMDPLAINYNPNASIDDGSCNYDTITCDTCQNGGWVSNIFSGSTCPTGWIPTSHVDPCKVGTVICDGCQNGAPVSQIFNSSVCPEGWIPTGSGDPCPSVPSWDCFENEVGKLSTCMEVFTGNGQYSSLANCQAGCNPVSWKCIGAYSGGTCIEVFDGTGGFLTEAECQAGCAGGGVGPVRGNGSAGVSGVSVSGVSVSSVSGAVGSGCDSTAWAAIPFGYLTQWTHEVTMFYNPPVVIAGLWWAAPGGYTSPSSGGTNLPTGSPMSNIQANIDYENQTTICEWCDVWNASGAVPGTFDNRVLAWGYTLAQAENFCNCCPAGGGPPPPGPIIVPPTATTTQ